MDNCKCSEHLVPVPSGTPEEIQQLLHKCKIPIGTSWVWLGSTARQQARAVLLLSRGLGAFSKDPVCKTLVEADSNSWVLHWDTQEGEAATY